jgi:thymidylate synthase (FAD)
MSKLYMNGTLRSWIHYCLLRMGNGTQKEHQDIANKCWDLLVEEFYFLKFLKDEKFTEAGVE